MCQQQGYQLAISLDSTNWLATYQLALFYQDLRRWGAASRYWAETLALRPRDEGALRNAIYSTYYARDLTTARNLLERYKDVATDRASYDELATIILAASGEENAARESLSRLPANLRDRLDQRITDWTELHELAQSRFRQAAIQQENAEEREDEEAGYDDEYGDRDEVEDELEDEPSRALAVDVVIIRTTEEIGSSRGINILKELQVSLGNLDEPGYLDTNIEETRRDSSVFIDEDGNTFPSGGSLDFNETDVISRAISIPAITYSMNIANVNGTRNEVLARPTLIAQDGEESSFFSGSNIKAVAVGGSNSDGATESIDVDVGVLLRIGADFHSDDEFTLAVEAERTFLQEPNRSAVTFPLFVSYSKTRAEGV
jgi:general secretion pathway protein D